MVIIGLCGGSGSGKSIVTKFFCELGFFGIDTDKVYRDITSRPSECLSALISEFGNGIIGKDGALDRRMLAKAVFNGSCADAKRKKLNEITHKYILAEVRNIISNLPKNTAAVVVDAPLLFESGYNSECDVVVSVIADKETRLERILKRDYISEEEAKRRITSQLPDSFLLENSDYVIVNNGDMNELFNSVNEVFKKITEKKGK